MPIFGHFPLLPFFTLFPELARSKRFFSLFFKVSTLTDSLLGVCMAAFQVLICLLFSPAPSITRLLLS